ncbi:sodium bile acid symporter family-domain-containing protein [Kockiozyma suomiensis]|uniref:sodium bile acid symporter family-domain-containing protein n=1 Tax=Kockiozyma suomiensis TaxID=1337062 RepID=UPI00334431A1
MASPSRSETSHSHDPLGAVPADHLDLERGDTNYTVVSARDSSDEESSPLLVRSTTTTTVASTGSELIRTETKNAPIEQLSILDRYLPLWIVLSMGIGIPIGYFFPDLGEKLERGGFAGVSIPIAIGLLIMMYPIMCKVQFESLHRLLTIKALWAQVAISLFINWIIAPMVMVGLSWVFLPDEPELREGLIMVGVARCIAMVMIWIELSEGDTDYGAILTAVNSLLQMVLFAPTAMFYINVVGKNADHLDIPYSVVAKSVAIFLGLPLLIAVITRFSMRGRLISVQSYDEKFMSFLEPFSLLGLLFTILVMFASQGREVVTQLTSVLRVMVPMFTYFVILFFGTLYLCYRMGYTYKICSAQAFTAASNNFELAIAVIVSYYGITSRQALAATVGPLLEVPVLLSFVYVMQHYRERIPWGHHGSTEVISGATI